MNFRVRRESQRIEIQSEPKEIDGGKLVFPKKVVLLIDEAFLLRLEVFAELHTLTQFEGDSKPVLPIILAGQNNLLDKLYWTTSLPLSSRVVARSHLKGVDRQGMEDYLNHHLKIAGLNHSVFGEQAVTAIHQGSGGLFRKANHLARGALIGAAAEKCQQVSAEHVRLASTELIQRTRRGANGSPQNNPKGSIQ